MTVKEIFAKVKALFDDTVTPDTSTAVAFSYPVDGTTGTVYVDCSDDGIAGIDQGDKVYTDPALTIPYPDGTYNVTGTQYGFTVSAGSVSAVTDAAGTGPGVPLEQSMAKPPVPPVAPPPPPAPPVAAAAPPVPPVPITPTAKMAEMTPESVASFFAAFATGTPEDRIANLELVCKALMEYNFGWQIREGQQKVTTDQAIEVYKQDLATAQASLATSKTAMAKQEAKLAGLFELVEQLVSVASADPKTLSQAQKDRFEKSKTKEERMAAMAEAIRKSKNK